MALEQEVMQKMKEAMKAKDSVALASLRSIKSEILKVKTSTSNKEDMDETEELKLVQKLVKQRKDSAEVYLEQNRKDLADAELAEVEVIEQFLPAQLSEEEIKAIIQDTGASSMKDMGKVMGMASQKLAGKADGKTISKIVKDNLS